MKSATWNYFHIKSDSDGQPSNLSKPVCSKCLKPVSATHGNTSNLFTHLRHKHPLLHAQKRSHQKPSGGKAKPSRSEDQPTIEHAFTQSQNYNRKSKKWQQLTNVVTKCIAKDMLPMAIVEKPGFKRTLETFDPRYQLPSRKYISQVTIPSLPCYKVQVISAVRLTFGQVSTCNLTLVILFTLLVTGNFRASVLQTLFMPTDHNGENLSESMKLVLNGWGLSEENQICITTDNGSNLVRAYHLLNWLHIPCFGHNLHLAITNTVKDDSHVARALGVIRKLITHFSHS